MRRIGILGGSFNPAHAGHLHISLTALKRLKLDAVWWLVAPQNPLKSRDDMAGYEARFASAEAIAHIEPRICVSHFEMLHGLRYTADTIDLLQRFYPGVHFVWLMGADNLLQVHRWRSWRHLFRHVPIAIFDRAPYSHRALRAKAAVRFRHARVTRAIIDLPEMATPAWAYLTIRRHPASSTQLRKKLGKKIVWRHNT